MTGGSGPRRLIGDGTYPVRGKRLKPKPLYSCRRVPDDLSTRRPDNVPSDLQAIEHQREQWIAAVNARDADRYVELLTEDIVWFPPGRPALSGRGAFESWVRPFFDRFHYEFALIEPDVQVAGDWAVERGTFQTDMRSLDDGQSGRHAGRYLVLWRKESDDTWRIERYIDETEAPGTAA